jgi:hypothetical protein
MSPKKSKAQPPVELAENFRRQIVETTRRHLAMRRFWPDGLCRFRRAAKTGPNSELALVFLWKRGQEPRVEVWPYATIEKLAAVITDAEVFAELERRSRWSQGEDGADS